VKERNHAEDKGAGGIDDNFKMDLKEMGWQGVGHDSPGSGYGHEVGCEHGNEPSGSIKCGESTQ